MNADPLHDVADSETCWSRVNVAEAMPGVMTPLGWTIWRDAIERATWAAYHRIGAVPRSAVRVPPSPGERIFGIFHGRVACNVDVSRALGDRLPGVGGDAIEALYLGQVRPGVRTRPRYERFPVVAARFPVVALRVDRELRAAAAAASATRSAARHRARPDPAMLHEAAVVFSEVLVPHVLASMLAQASYESLRKLAARAGRPGLESTLSTGYGGLAESELLTDLWALSREQLELTEFLDRHGYHGPQEGEISGVTWGIDPTPVLALAQRYRTLDAAGSPAAIEHRQAKVRSGAEAELLAALPPARRRLARATLDRARVAIPRRELGKASFLRALDAARHEARHIGAWLAADGRLERPEDVFMLTLDELNAGGPVILHDWRETVAERVEQRARHAAIDLPTAWTGNPDPAPAARRSIDAGPVSGIGVSPGLARGAARIVVDPATDVVEEGEVLVCHTTDPSWASAFLLAAAVVIDIGGPMSHGAIVARELGIPCVINTIDGSRRLTTGATVEVDGAAGTVIPV